MGRVGLADVTPDLLALGDLFGPGPDIRLGPLPRTRLNGDRHNRCYSSTCQNYTDDSYET